MVPFAVAGILLVCGADPVSFTRDVLPILSDKCFACHGPDATSRKADLRLDDATSARDTGAIVPGKPEESELLKRVLSTNANTHMPPAKSGKKLTPQETELLRAWVASGARYEKHWAFVPVARPAIPAVRNQGWVRNPVDFFVLARLEKSGKTPSALADSYVLARRLAFDLTGLPPSDSQIASLARNASATSIGKFSDELMATNAFAERMAWDWLDAARYADTDGFQGDADRTNWPWRDWVVNAFRTNMPFDRFTLEQCAGDLLPGNGPEQVLATAFHRHHMTNGEGGRDPEESRIDYVIDRVNTVGTAWLGLTLGCCQCHDHKYDPVSQADYYRMSAFFDSIDEDGKAGKAAKPYLKYQSQHVARGIEAGQRLVDERKAAESRTRAEAMAPFTTWLKTARAHVGAGKRAWQPANPLRAESVEGTTLRVVDGCVVASGNNPRQDDYKIVFRPNLPWVTGIKVEVLPGEHGVGRGADGHVILTDIKITARSSAKQQARDVVIATAVADFQPDTKKHGGYGNVRDTLDDDPRNGWASFDRDVKEPRTLVFALSEPVQLDPHEHLVAELRQRSTMGDRNIAKMRLWATDQAGEAARTLATAPIDELAKVGSGEIPKKLENRLFEQFLATFVPHRQAAAALARAEKQLAETKAVQSVDVMVLAQRKEPRSTHVLVRGVWDKKGAKVEAGAIPSMAPWPKNTAPDRLGLARWLTSRENPLTARVVVNRLWQQCFSAGLVRTPEDFGLQGDAPTHPELLDWLASEFMDSGWNQRHILKLITTSATYAQSSNVSAEALAHDPDNRLLARQTRYRLPSWMIRDITLADSGLLNPAMGGPPVRPPQPLGVWEDISMGRNRYEATEGPEQYRRTLYAFWRRSAAPAFLFDSAQRRVCEVRFPRTNTPMQALALQNDPVRLEAARALASRTFINNQSDTEVVAAMFRRILSRPPTPAESAVLVRELVRAKTAFSNMPDAAGKYLNNGAFLAPASIDKLALASRAVVAGMIFNLDEAVSRE